MIRIICVCGARPNFMKTAPLIEALRRDGSFDVRLVHTGQHYDQRMSGQFFTELGMPKPDIKLEVGSGSHAVQTATIMTRFEPVCESFDPHWVLVVGDVNSTIACALVAAKRGIRVAHVEAGLRSFDRTMPEEINRILTDSISDLLFVTEADAVQNLTREGIDTERIHHVGNVMIDTLMAHRERGNATGIVKRLGLKAKQFGVVTLHRPANVDDTDTLMPILQALSEISTELPLVFPVHPRTLGTLRRIDGKLAGMRIVEPLGYLEFLGLLDGAAVVLTDSGGIQEEATVLGVPCITMRKNTERPVTITQGTNHLAGTSREGIRKAYDKARKQPARENRIPPFWDGHAAERIVEILRDVSRQPNALSAPVRSIATNGQSNVTKASLERTQPV